jgi:hypothetical protein
MNPIPLLIIAVVFAFTASAPASPVVPPISHTSVPIAPETLEDALPILQSRYLDFAALNYKPGDTLDELLRRSQGAISLGPAQLSAAPPILTALLPGDMIYCRLASFRPATSWSDLDDQLRAWTSSGAQGIILDLRSTETPADFEGAARVASLFVPAGTALFSIKDAQSSHSYASVASESHVDLGSEPVTVLINSRTSGAAEALAAFLKANGALTIGRWTAGNGALFEIHPLPSGLVLGYVAGEVTMADGTPLWRAAVSPDIGLMVDPVREQTVLDLIGQGKILDVIRESAGSHRLSEAALVQGEDPAVDAYLVPAAKQPAVPQDSSLVTALDSLKAIRLSQRTPGAFSATEDEPKIPSTEQ